MVKMDSGLWHLFALTFYLTVCRTGAQTSPSASITSITPADLLPATAAPFTASNTTRVLFTSTMTAVDPLTASITDTLNATEEITTAAADNSTNWTENTPSTVGDGSTITLTTLASTSNHPTPVHNRTTATQKDTNPTPVQNFTSATPTTDVIHPTEGFNSTTIDPHLTSTDTPSAGPTTGPDFNATDAPTAGPTTSPHINSTNAPTAGPSTGPNLTTTTAPTAGPTTGPNSNATDAPTAGPTTGPHNNSTNPTTADPTTSPSLTPTTAPTAGLTTGPDLNATNATTAGPTTRPYLTTTTAPTVGPTTGPDLNATNATTAGPTTASHFSSSAAPTAGPTTGSYLTTTTAPTAGPTTGPDLNITNATTAGPTTRPYLTTTTAPTAVPTTASHFSSSATPTAGPSTGSYLTTTTAPTVGPTATPNSSATDAPTAGPTNGPTTVYNMTTAGNSTVPSSTVSPSTTTDSFSTTPSIFPTSTKFPTASSTTNSPPTTTPLVCNNGGEPLNGVCICPDEWTGATCSQENFCREQELNGFKFPRTTVGWFAYSEEICPKGTSGEGKPQASIRCSKKNGQPDFDRPPQVLQCEQTLSDIQQNLTSPAALETLASSTQILTSRPEALTAENVTAAAQIANTLLLSPNATESVRVAAVATVSQLLTAEAPDSTEEDNSTLGLTQTLDQLSVNLSLSLNTSQSQVVQPNLVVQSAQVPATDTQGVQFTSLSGTSGSFIADRIQLNTNTSTPVVENGFIADALIFVQFSPEPAEAVSGHRTPSNVSLGFVLYQNDRFFRSKLYRRSRASIRVLSGSVHGRGRNVVPQHVEMMFRPRTVEGASLYNFACVFWDYNVNDWSTAGCWKGNASDGVLQCFCNHTTNFAALWSFREDYEYAEALSLISIIGLSVSILGLVATIVHHIIENCYRVSGGRQKNRKSQVSLLCVYLSLLTFIIIFLSGVQNSSRPGDVQLQVQTNIIPPSDEHVESDVGTCTATAALLHYFLLATFIWNSLYGSELVLLIHSMRRSLPSHWTSGSLAVGWGVPAVVVAITLGVTYRVEDPLKYRQEEFCWLAALDKDKQFHFGAPMFWGFLIPVGLILIYNLILLILVSTTTCRSNPQLKSSKSFSLKKKVMVSLSLTVMLGLSWTIGYLVLVTSGDAHLVFSILFCLSTTTQGFQIFILFTARTRTFRANLSRAVHPIHIPLKYSKYNLTKLSGSNTESTSESYRELWIPADLHQSYKKQS